MTQFADHIIERYRSADQSDQLYLYLHYRDLRDIFLKIDDENVPVNSPDT